MSCIYSGRDVLLVCVFFFQAEDGIRDLVRSRGLGDVYKRQLVDNAVKFSNGDDKRKAEYLTAELTKLPLEEIKDLSLIHI